MAASYSDFNYNATKQVKLVAQKLTTDEKEKTTLKKTLRLCDVVAP